MYKSYRMSKFTKLALTLVGISIVVHLVLSQYESKCRRYLFDNVNPNILNQNLTDAFKNQTLECIATSRGGNRSDLYCYSCEEYVCALNCLVYEFGNVSTFKNINKNY